MWTWEEVATNCIALSRDGIMIAEITTDTDISEEQRKQAQFIVDACNAKEAS